MTHGIEAILVGSEEVMTQEKVERLLYWWVEQEIRLAYCPAYTKDGVEYKPWQYGYWQ